MNQRAPAIQHNAGAFTHPIESFQKRRPLPRNPCQHVATLGFLLDEKPSGVRVRPIERSQPDVSVSFVEEVSNRETIARHLLHVVTERPHARHDLLAVVVFEETVGHAVSNGAVRSIPLRLKNHGRRRSERRNSNDKKRGKKKRAWIGARLKPPTNAPAPIATSGIIGIMYRIRNGCPLKNATNGRRALARSPSVISEPALRRSTIARMSRNSSPIEATVIVNGPVRTRVPHPTSSSAASGRPKALFSGTKKPLIVTHSPVTTRLEMTNRMMASAG